jgi:cell wall-associated NlpC family hydrolase
MRIALRFAAAVALLAALLVSGCATVPAPPAAPPPPPESRPPPPAPSPRGQGVAIARAATLMLGAPYHFGGADAAGFDCSGLALYAHETVGLAIPRTALEQQRAAHPVPLPELSPGDLVFFRIRSRHVDHVGIYAGDGRFIHAPRAGLAVAYADLSRGFYAQHLVSAGRFW